MSARTLTLAEALAFEMFSRGASREEVQAAIGVSSFGEFLSALRRQMGADLPGAGARRSKNRIKRAPLNHQPRRVVDPSRRVRRTKEGQAQLSVWIPRSLKDDVAEAAKRSGETLLGWVAEALEQRLDDLRPTFSPRPSRSNGA